MGTQNTWMKLGLFIVLGFLVIGCGTQNFNEKSGVAGLSSETTTTTISSEGKTLSACSRDAVTGNDLEFNVAPYKEVNGMNNPNIVRLKIKSIPAIYQTQKLELRFYKWKASSAGDTYIESKPLEFRFEKMGATGTWDLISGQDSVYSKFNIEDVKKMGTFAKIDATSANSFYNNVSIRVYLNDPDMIYQVIRVSLQVPGASTAQEIRKEDALMPPFFADPNHYTAVKPAVLSALHPLKSQSSSFSQADYLNFTRDFCF